MKLIIFLTLIIALNARLVIKRDEMTGCDSPKLFVDSNEFKIIKIDFQTACNNLQTCADDLNTRRETCLQAFNTQMVAECEDYTSFNGLRKRYCNAIAEENLQIAQGLDNSAFTNYEVAFKALAYNQDVKTCVGSAGLAVLAASCSGQFLTFIRLFDNSTNSINFNDGEIYVIRNTLGNCLSGILFETCNFNDEKQRWKVEASRTAAGMVSISNNGLYLTVPVSAAALTVAEYKTNLSDINLDVVVLAENETN
jgi:hypothetical protein